MPLLEYLEPSYPFLKEYFNSYEGQGSPPYTFNPDISPKANFEVLIKSISPKNVQKVRTKFLEALENSNLSNPYNELAIWFGSKFYEFDYDEESLYEKMDGHTTILNESKFVETWRDEFERLGRFRGWKVGGKKYRKEKGQFEQKLSKRLAEEGRHYAVNCHDKEDLEDSVTNEGKTDCINPQTTNTTGQAKSPNRIENQPIPDTSAVESLTSEQGPQEQVHVSEKGPQINNSAQNESNDKPSAGTIPFNNLSPLDRFFGRFDNCSYDPSEPSENEFDRISEVLSWDDSQYETHLFDYYASVRQEFKYQLYRHRDLGAIKAAARTRWRQISDALAGKQISRRARRRFKVAQKNGQLPTVVEEEGEDELPEYRDAGTPQGVMEGWKRLCIILSLGIPKTEIEAQKILAQTFINIYDFIHAMRRDTIHKMTRFDTLKELSDYSYNTGLVFPFGEAFGDDILKHLLRPIGIGRRRP